MFKKMNMVAAIILIVLACWQVLALEIPYTNVKDYGAIGDGVTDDTGAIQNAITAAALRSVSTQINGVYVDSWGTVFFPSGRYKITQSLDITPAKCVNLLGEGSSIIDQTSSSSNIIDSGDVWRTKIEKLHFSGGNIQIKIGNSNTDASKYIIRDCNFTMAGNAAIYVAEDTKSCQLTIENCIFRKNEQALVTPCDNTTLKSCWITASWSGAVDKAVIENTKGSLLLFDVILVPGETDQNRRWIDNYNRTTCIRTRFGGERGGFTPIYNYAEYKYTYPISPTSIILEKCEISAAGNANRRCAVYCFQVPNQIIIRDSTHMAGATYAVQVDSSVNLDTYFNNAASRPRALKYLVENNNVEIFYDYCQELPEQMRPYQANPVEMSAPPTTGYWWKTGTFIRNKDCANNNDPFGWQNDVAGTPGTWTPIYRKTTP